MVSKNILNGSKKIIKVGFLSEQTSGWMGGVNYFKNLFIAISAVDNTKIIPYILPQEDERAKILLNYANIIEFKKDIKYRLAKFLTKLRRKKFKKESFFYNNINVDLISHAQFVTNKSSITWIPDFQHVHLPEMFSQKEIEIRNKSFMLWTQNSSLVILSSQDALNDFKKFAPEFAYKGRVLNFVAIPDENIYQKTDEIKETTIKKFNLPEKYFYVPNQFWVHKNHKIIFEAISILKQQGIDIKIVFTGNASDYRNKEYFDELMKFVKEKNIEDNIKLLGLIDSLEVYYLMRNCISIINPSLFEGWSSTVEEAKSLGKNIILSNINVHKEQNPPQGVYFDPNNSNELAELLKEKWLNGKSEPDFELEKIAQEQLENRIIEFGKNYQNIVLEAL